MGSPGSLRWDSLAQELASIEQSSRMEFYLRVGELVAHRLYGGKLGAWRARRGGDASFRKLAAHPGHNLSATTMFRAVSAYELSTRIPFVPRSEHLRISHVEAVLGLPESAQASLLLAAERQRWSVAQLELEAEAWRGVRQKSGRPRKPLIVKALDRVAALEGAQFDDVASLSRLDEALVLRYERSCAQVVASLTTLLERLRERGARQPAE